MTDVLTVQEVADRMRCEHRTVRRAIKAGELEAAMIGGKWLIREHAVEEWFQARVARSEGPRPQRARIPRRRASSGPDRVASVARLEAIDGRTVTG